MNVWQPDTGEILIARAPVTFATGAAMRVRGMRWFRDTERHDIQRELRGWPEGPSFAARSVGEAAGRGFFRGAATTAGVAVMAFLSSAGGNLTGSVAADDSGTDTPQDPADETEDFPVMWAAPGSLARTLPWQLDPGRSDEKRQRTHLIVTDRRLVVVGLPHDKKDVRRIDDEVLWQCARTDVARVEPKNFKDGYDFRITFVDGSWCRLSSFQRRHLTLHLTQPLELIPLHSLSRAQQQTVSDYAQELRTPASVTPILTLNPTGRIRVEILHPDRFTSDFGASVQFIVMDSEGKRVSPDDYLPEDFR
ncbi:hypothetical protein [Streptomyces sp. NPDC058739]|uniref:hypothetical protein n=1 Tax=Streptomyces sp. NPDC058739 TaxID=3346618 RepID=UPI0036CCDD8F